MAYTINKIQDEMTAAGSHWWDRGTLQYFRCRVSEKVYQGEAGVYFVTSEKYSDDATRLYSVRQYKPDTKDVDTIGEFNSMSRAQAHREAARLAGPEAVIVEEAHRPVGDAEQLTTDISRGGGRCSPAVAGHLIRMATRHHRLMEDYCNGIEVYDDDGEPLPQLAILRQKITKAAKECLCDVLFSGDPRGCTVKLVLPNGETNDFGKEGWCIPTRN
ncbi:hypothetical protein LCGC14_0974280 [marine sediment metagenome]|uniref:Uncharacterized protein n=1 Tax=marine sediment metagenome TaxID=412755 RepID=A0A0F9RH30_9ZZZZ